MEAQTIRFHATGGPEVLKAEAIDIGTCGTGQVLIKQTACGLNYLDTYQRSGAYPLPLPSGCGNEAAGVVEAIGPDVKDLKIGDRVAYAMGEPGAYASHRIFPAARLVKIPEGISDEIAAASMLKGMTTEYLLQRCAPLRPGHFALMYAAAGGVGLFAGQWAKAIGVNLIGVAAGEEKCALAKANGYHSVIDRTKEDVLMRVKEITGGKGLPVVYDSIGKATFETSMNCLQPRGVLVSFGATSGLPPAIEMPVLQKMGSLYVTRPTLGTYAASRADLDLSSGALFKHLKSGAVKPHIGHRYALAEAAQAHADLEAGKTQGSQVLVP